MTPPHGHHPIMLARHGQTAWSHDGRYQGQSDPPLSAAGMLDAEALAASLRRVSLGVIVSSPLQRARQTAAILVRMLGLTEAEIDPDLTEISYGAWEGLTQPVVKRYWPDLLRAWKRAPETVHFPGGEALSDVQSRIRRCLPIYTARAARTPVLLITHSIWIRLALIESRGLPPSDFRSLPIPTGSLHALRTGFVHPCPQPKEQISCVSQ